MSLEIQTFVPSVKDSQIPLWLSRMAELGMLCEIYPAFSFVTHSGFVPFKLQIQDSAHPELNGVGFLTGFEYYISDFSLDAALEAKACKPSLLTGEFEEKSQQGVYASQEIDEQLKPCRKCLHFLWGSADLFELRMATVSAAVLAEITGGISFYPADGIWYERTSAAAKAVSEARDYENLVTSKDIPVHRFERWS